MSIRDNPASMKRILHVVGSMDCGGAETLIMNVFRAMDPARFCFDFAVGNPGYYDQEIRELGGRIAVYPEPSKVGPVRFSRTFTEIAKRTGPYCAVHSHVQFLNGLVMYAASRADVPIRIAHSHTTTDVKGDGMRRLYRLAMRRLIQRYATHRVCCGAEAGRYLFGRHTAPVM